MKCLKTCYQQTAHINCTRDASQSYLLLFLLLAGDIAINPGPTHLNKTVYPCALCENPVTWSTDGVCCDECSLWHHRSCIEMSIADYNLLHRSHVQWLCYKCNSINVDSFTYHSFELKSSNSFSVLSDRYSVVHVFVFIFKHYLSRLSYITFLSSSNTDFC